MSALLRYSILLAWCGLTFADDLYDIETRRLLSPTPAELASEERGRIYIYDGLRDVDVERALDEQFTRVEHMMFIRVKVTDDHGKPEKDSSTGVAVIQDDGC